HRSQSLDRYERPPTIGNPSRLPARGCQRLHCIPRATPTCRKIVAEVTAARCPGLAETSGRRDGHHGVGAKGKPSWAIDGAGLAPHATPALSRSCTCTMPTGL